MKVGVTPYERNLRQPMLPEKHRRIATDCADSIFRYIARTAEPVADGVRWQTLNYEDELHYDPNLFNGVGGIPLFLADYHRVRGDEHALALALGAAKWSSAPHRLPSDTSVGYGMAGIGLAWLRIHSVSQDQQALREAVALGERTLTTGPGPRTGFLFGTAGVGTFLLRLWEASSDERFLDGAQTYARWLKSVATESEAGLFWPVNATRTGRPFVPGFCRGTAGIGHFFAALALSTGDAEWVDVASKAATTLVNHAQSDHGGLNWPSEFGEPESLQCQWCRGAAGVGLFLTRAYAVSRETHHLNAARLAGEATYQYKDVRSNPCQCHGLAGNAELFLELYNLTGDSLWLDRAGEFADLAETYRIETAEGVAWQADVPGHTSPDYLCGAAGTGHFYLRLLDPKQLTMPIL